MTWRAWHIPLLIGFAGINLFARAEVGMTSQPGKDSVWEVLLDSGLNWRLILFIVLPIQLLWALRVAQDRAEPQFLHRFGGYRWWGFGAFLVSLRQAGTLVGCLASSALAVAIGTPGDAAWREFGQVDRAVLAGASLLAATMGLALLASAVQLGVAWGARLMGSITALLIFAAALTGSAAPIPAMANVMLAVKPIAAVEEYDAASLGLLVPIAELLGIVWTFAWFLDLRAQGRGRALRAPLVLAAVTALIMARLHAPWENPQEALLGTFFGSGGGLVDQTLLAIILLAPVWLALTAFERHLSDAPAQLMREGTVAAWFWRRSRAAVGWYPVYLAALLMAALAVLAVRWGSPTSLTVLGPAAYQWLVNGTLQGWFCLGCVLLTRWATARSDAALIALGILSAAGLALARNTWFPWADIGLGTIADGTQPWLLTGPLLGWLSLLVLVGAALLTRFSPPLLERNLTDE